MANSHGIRNLSKTTRSGKGNSIYAPPSPSVINDPIDRKYFINFMWYQEATYAQEAMWQTPHCFLCMGYYVASLYRPTTLKIQQYISLYTWGTFLLMFQLCPNDFWHKRKIYNFDPYNVFLAIAINIPQRLKTGFVVQSHICVCSWVCVHRGY